MQSAPPQQVALLQILGSGPSAAQMATGSLVADSGQTVSCSRAASAYCLDNSGVLHLLGANTVRVEPNGILVEGASTNFCLQSNSLATSPWTPENLVAAAPTITNNTTDVVDPAGGNTASKVVIPAVLLSQFSFVRQGVTPGSGSNRISFYARVLSGTGTTYLTDSTNVATINLTSSWQRFSIASTGSVNLDIGTNTLNVGQSATSAVTVYIWDVQVDPLPFATSPMISGASQATRDADMVSANNPLPAGPFTMAATMTPVGTSFGTWAVLGVGESNAPNTAIGLMSGTSPIFQVNDVGAAQKQTSGSAVTFAAHRYAYSSDSSGNIAVYSDGVSIGGAPVGGGTGKITVAPTKVYLGTINGAGGILLNGWLNRIYLDTNPAKVPLT